MQSSRDPTRFFDPTIRNPGQRIVLICDWLPPDFGAVGQYALQRAEQLAFEGHEVTLIGFNSSANFKNDQQDAPGTPKVLRIHRRAYEKTSILERAFWTLGANIALLWAARSYVGSADEVIFTGSPPYLLHFIVPANLLWQKKLVYRITDFHPECLMAEYEHVPLWLRAIYRLTLFWRRRIPFFEAIGEDQQQRLADIGISNTRIRLVRDPSPVAFPKALAPRAKPQELANLKTILYSGNFGVAHDHQTFLDGYAKFQSQCPAFASFWLNAVGKRADVVEQQCHQLELGIHRSQPVPLSDLASLLIAADLHLITLRDNFVGYVLPSKVYACIDSGRPILFIGSAKSDVHLLCSQSLSEKHYRRVAVGDADGVATALIELLNN